LLNERTASTPGETLLSCAHWPCLFVSNSWAQQRVNKSKSNHWCHLSTAQDLVEYSYSFCAESERTGQEGGRDYEWEYSESEVEWDGWAVTNWRCQMDSNHGRQAQPSL
jgi:hypothetical protein